MAEYKSTTNSPTTTEDGKRAHLQPLTEGKLKKKNKIEKLGDVFLAEDIETTKKYVFNSIVVPTIKRMIMNTLGSFLGVGYGGYQDVQKSYTVTNGVPYKNFYGQQAAVQQTKTPKRYGYENPVVPNVGVAKSVIYSLENIIKNKGHASVLDLYELCGVETQSTDPTYGWFDISGYELTEYRGECLIRMPPPYPIK